MSTKANEVDDAADTYVSIRELTDTNPWINRLHELQEFYEKQFGKQPKFFVRVPGRVNIIGEHVDYCGYPVLPMAIDQCILLAVDYSQENSFLDLRNIDEKFENFKCELNSFTIDIEDGSPKWYKYFLCGIKGIFDTLENDQQPIGMTIAVSGNIPPASGLSSSSALVSSATLATAHVNQIPLNRKTLASISASCERYIGTQGGGMDQAIAYLAKDGCAQCIEFYPNLKATPINLPKGACFVVANSLAESNKAASSDFNQRVVECRIGCRFLAKKLNLNCWKDLVRFAQLQSELKCDLPHLERLILLNLTQDLYQREDIIKEFGITDDEFETDFLTSNTRKLMEFKLQQRALHVLQESIRVHKFRSICENPKVINGKQVNGKASSVMDKSQSQFSMLTQLMCQSHYSLRYLYECSHPDLDRLIDISQIAGVGARLTGAGWGGCIVSLCESMEASEKYIKLLKNTYYSDMEKNSKCLDDVVFATFPSNGAEIFLNKESRN